MPALTGAGFAVSEERGAGHVGEAGEEAAFIGKLRAGAVDGGDLAARGGNGGAGAGDQHAVATGLAVLRHQGFELLDGTEDLGGFGLAEAAFELCQEPASTLGFLNRLQQILELQGLVLDRHDETPHTLPHKLMQGSHAAIFVESGE